MLFSGPAVMPVRTEPFRIGCDLCKAIAAGKSIWVKVYSGEFEDWIRNVDRIVNKYGSHSLFLLFPEMSMEQAAYLLDYADRNWSDVKGTFVESLGR